jgi:hypothetical protein
MGIPYGHQTNPLLTGAFNAASYLHRDGILGVRKLACAFDWARLNGSNNHSATPEGCSKLQHSKAPSAQKQKTCGINRGAAGEVLGTENWSIRL